MLEEDTYRYCTGRKATRKLEVYGTLDKDNSCEYAETDISRTSSSLDLRLLSITALS